MKTIVFGNMKGGTGKTSLSVSLAAELAGQGRTALLDFDPQGSATAWAAPESADLKSELADVLQGRAEARAAIIPTDTPGLSLLPTYGIGGALKHYIENAEELAINKAVKNLIAVVSRQGFRYCIIDLSPAFGKIERAVIIAADEFITPILADRFSLDGLESIAANIAELKSLVESPIADYRRIIINGIDGRIKRHAEITEKLKAGASQAVYVLPIDQVFFRAQTASRTIQSMDAKQETHAEIARLANDIKEGAV